jgi:hypothetical protein
MKKIMNQIKDQNLAQMKKMIKNMNRNLMMTMKDLRKFKVQMMMTVMIVTKKENWLEKLRERLK